MDVGNEKRKASSWRAVTAAIGAVVLAIVGAVAAIEPVRDLAIHIIDGSFFDKEPRLGVFGGSQNETGVLPFGAAFGTSSQIEIDGIISKLKWSMNPRIRRAASLIENESTQSQGLELLSAEAKSPDELFGLWVVAQRFDLNVAVDATNRIHASNAPAGIKSATCIFSARDFTITGRESEFLKCLADVDVDATLTELQKDAKDDTPQDRQFFLQFGRLYLGGIKYCYLNQYRDAPEDCLQEKLDGLLPLAEKKLTGQSEPYILNLVMERGKAVAAKDQSHYSFFAYGMWPKASSVKEARLLLANNKKLAEQDLASIYGRCHHTPMSAGSDTCAEYIDAFKHCEALSEKWLGYQDSSSLLKASQALTDRFKSKPADPEVKTEIAVARSVLVLWGRPRDTVNLDGAEGSDASDEKDAGTSIDVDGTAGAIRVCVGGERADRDLSQFPKLAEQVEVFRAISAEEAKKQGGTAYLEDLLLQGDFAARTGDFGRAIRLYSSVVAQSDRSFLPSYKIQGYQRLANIYHLKGDVENFEAAMLSAAEVARHWGSVEDEVTTYDALAKIFNPNFRKSTIAERQFSDAGKMTKYLDSAVSAASRSGATTLEIHARINLAKELCRQGDKAGFDEQQELVNRVVVRSPLQRDRYIANIYLYCYAPGIRVSPFRGLEELGSPIAAVNCERVASASCGSDSTVSAPVQFWPPHTDNIPTALTALDLNGEFKINNPKVGRDSLTAIEAAKAESLFIPVK